MNTILAYPTADYRLSCSFIALPKDLLLNEKYKDLGANGILLYAALYDRMTASVANGWCDETGKVYIKADTKFAMDVLGCGRNVALKTFQKLIETGLIERVQTGWKNFIIYVKVFMNDSTSAVNDHENGSEYQIPSAEDISTNDAPSEPAHDQIHVANGSEKVSVLESESVTSTARNSFQTCDAEGTAKEYMSESVSSKANKSLKRKSQGLKSKPCMVSKKDPNKTNSNSNIKCKEKSLSNQSDQIRQEDTGSAVQDRSRAMNDMNDINDIAVLEACSEIVKENIEYEHFKNSYPYNRLVDEILDLILETVTTDADKIWVARELRSAAYVKSRFMKLNSDHIEYVIDRFRSYDKGVGNIKNFLLTMLYNATFTMDAYYIQQVNADLRCPA